MDTIVLGWGESNPRHIGNQARYIPVSFSFSGARPYPSHGGAKNVSSRLYRFSNFGLHPDTLLIDYDAAERLASEFRPKLLVVGSAAYSRKIDYERLAGIAHRNGALLMTDIAHFSGLMAAGVLPSPVPFADIVTASTTKTMCGPHSAFILCREALADRIDRSVYPGVVSSLHLQTIAAMGYALHRARTEEFRSLMRRVVSNAQAFCEALLKRGFGIVTGGTDCHMFVADLRPFGTDCERLANVMQDVGITVNTKGIPYDDSPTARGLRAGTTVLTQRGMGPREMDQVADLWKALATGMDDPQTVQAVRERVLDLAKRFPLPSE